MEEKTLSIKNIYKGRIIYVHVDDIELPDGKPGTREVVEHPGGVCIAAMTDKNELLFVRQFRYPFKDEILELPAGKMEKGEDPFATAQRELMEETGCTGKDWVFMGNMYPTPGICSETDRLYLCHVDKESGRLDLDEDEFIEPERVPLKRAAEMAMNGELPDAKTQLLVLKTVMYLNSGI